MDGMREHSVGQLEITVTAGETGPVVTLSGESDQSVTGQLRDALDALISGGAQHVTVDVSRLLFADSAAIRVLLETDRALKRAGGFLELTFPQPVVAVALHLMGVDRILTIRTQAGTGTGEAGADASLLMAAADFAVTIPHMTPAQRQSLAELLARAHPGHQWLANL